MDELAKPIDLFRRAGGTAQGSHCFEFTTLASEHGKLSGNA
jgi:hypothetical protein